MTDLFIPVILGTARPGRRSASVAAHVVDSIKQRGVRTDLIDVADFDLTATHGPSVDLGGYRAVMSEADGLVIVAPEYNHGYPGELKLLLDSEYEAYARKPVGIVGVSVGRLGGARMVEQLQLVATALRMVPVAPTLLVPDVEHALDPQGRFTDPYLGEVAEAMLGEVEWYAEALRTARAKGS